MKDGDTFWHRIGDVGYIDDVGRFWFCGRKSHRVRTAEGTMFTEQCEAIINSHRKIYRSALVGVGPPGGQMPVIIAEPWPENWPKNFAAQMQLLKELRELAQQHELTQCIEQFFLMRSLPVDIRHNAKIFREKLAVMAEQLLRQT